MSTKDSKTRSSTESTKNTFFAKAIENWLTNTNELGYQIPFCQLLINEGLHVVHISKHNPFEQGKDIIAVASDGTPHIYQLKGGNISLRDWRNIVKAEVEELIDLPIVHPSVDKSKTPVPYLVTNGYLDDTVRWQIDSLNSSKWKNNPIRVVLFGELLARFLKWSYEFTPKEIANYKLLLDLYFSDGREFINERLYAELIESVIQLEEPKLSNEQRKRNIAAAVVFTGYISASLKNAENHIALINIFTVLASYILGTAERHQLPEPQWLPSLNLVWNEIEGNAAHLEREVVNGAFHHLYRTPWDGELAPYRKHLAASYLFAFKLGQLISGDDEWESLQTKEVFTELLSSFKVWGEAALIGILFCYVYLRRLAPSSEIPPGYLVLALELIVFFNGRKSSFGLLSPYHAVETGITYNLGIPEEDDVREDFVLQSYFLHTVIDLLVRAGKRDVLEKYWREISYIQMVRFVPAERWMYYRSRSFKGKQVDKFPKATESWAALVAEAHAIDEAEIPDLLMKHNYLLPFYLLAFPHRANTQMFKYLDQLTTPTGIPSL